MLVDIVAPWSSARLLVDLGVVPESTTGDALQLHRLDFGDDLSPLADIARRKAKSFCDSGLGATVVALRWAEVGNDILRVQAEYLVLVF